MAVWAEGAGHQGRRALGSSPQNLLPEIEKQLQEKSEGTQPASSLSNRRREPSGAGKEAQRVFQSPGNTCLKKAMPATSGRTYK